MRFGLTPLLVCASLLTAPVLAQGELRGHGGPVRALAVNGDAQQAISGSFDTSAIIWSLPRGSTLHVLRAHDSAVNAVLALPQSGFATGGEDGQIAVWQAPDFSKPQIKIKVHEGPIAALAVSQNGSLIASASWDSSFAVTRLIDSTIQRFNLHQGNVNGVAFSRDDKSLISIGYDATLRITELASGQTRTITLHTPLNALAISPLGDLAAGGADGSLFLFAPDGTPRHQIEAAEAPVLALAFAADGTTIAAASPRGSVSLFDVASGKRLVTLNGPGLPVWSLAFTPDGRQLLTGGGDAIIRRWDARSGDHMGPLVPQSAAQVGPESDGSQGAQVFKACAACHSLTEQGGNRAGPSLYGVLGRRIGRAPGYVYSPDFASHDIVWTKETIARLFELGPSVFTPGTKMPEQKLVSPQDREALVDFIERATQAR